jgi:hypothetical protein
MKNNENIHIGIAHDLTLYIVGKEYLTISVRCNNGKLSFEQKARATCLLVTSPPYVSFSWIEYNHTPSDQKKVIG